jgi:electron transfer flavoprotein beta subunit
VTGALLIGIIPSVALVFVFDSHKKEKSMKILAFLKIVEDTKVLLDYSYKTGKLLPECNIHHLNPADKTAVETAIRIKKSVPATHITLIHMGPASGERFIREGLALGADEGLRIWDEHLDESSVNAKAFIFARAAHILGFDLILVGNRSMDTIEGQLGILLASCLNLPVVSSVIDVDINQGKGKVIALKSLSGGYRERVECPLPLVITMEASDNVQTYAPLPALLDAYEKEIPCWDLTEIGIPAALIREKNALSRSGPLMFPKPRLRSIPAPDSLLPAFERIRQLLEGTLKPREGKIIKDNEDSVVGELFQTLLTEGWLDHLKKTSSVS